MSVEILGTSGNLYETLAVFWNLDKAGDYTQNSFSSRGTRPLPNHQARTLRRGPSRT